MLGHKTIPSAALYDFKPAPLLDNTVMRTWYPHYVKLQAFYKLGKKSWERVFSFFGAFLCFSLFLKNIFCFHHKEDKKNMTLQWDNIVWSWPSKQLEHSGGYHFKSRGFFLPRSVNCWIWDSIVKTSHSQIQDNDWFFFKLTDFHQKSSSTNIFVQYA